MQGERPPTFTRHEDGRVTVDYWPDHAEIEIALYDPRYADPRFVQVETDYGNGGDITFTVDNGKATYRIEGVVRPGVVSAFAVCRQWQGLGRGR